MSAVGWKERRRKHEEERGMEKTYPSRDEAMHYRNALEEAVEAAHKGEGPKKDASEGLNAPSCGACPYRHTPGIACCDRD